MSIKIKNKIEKLHVSTRNVESLGRKKTENIPRVVQSYMNHYIFNIYTKYRFTCDFKSNDKHFINYLRRKSCQLYCFS